LTAARPSSQAQRWPPTWTPRDQHLAANYDAQVIPRHKLWTNDGWLVTPSELTAALQHAPEVAMDRRQRPIPWWHQWLDYLDGARGHGGFRVH
jgi:hypothetical protein